MKLGIVVDKDPQRRCSEDIGVVRAIDADHTFVIGRVPNADLIVNDPHVNRKNCGIALQEEGWVVRDYGSTNGVWINGARIEDEHVIQPGDCLHYGRDPDFSSGSIVLRFVVVDPLGSLLRIGDWILLGASARATPQAAPAFRVRGGLQRGWLVTTSAQTPQSSAEDRDVALWARSAGSRDALPAVVDSFVGKRSVHRVFDVADHIDVDRFAVRAAPASSTVAVRVALDLARAISTVFDDSHRQQTSRLRAGVTFDGRVILLPRATPFIAHTDLPEPETEPLVALLAAMQPQHAQLRALAHPERWRLPFPEFDEGLRRVAHETGVASDDELAGVVRGLFPEEFRAAVELHEQLETLDDAAVDRLIAAK